jgi:FkbM family methyltransferase
MPRYVARIPMVLEVPEAMHWAIKDVLEGEYEAHYDGRGLDILDIGANVGSFALWASARWPGSHVTSFEPHPETFKLLTANAGGRKDITLRNAALFPGGMKKATFLSRYAGDGESTLAAYAADTFVDGHQVHRYEVDVVDPASLPSADVVKIDIEGGEGEVLNHLDLSRTSLVLLEFQNGKNREMLRERLSADFDILRDEACEWSPILGYKGYRQDLAGDVYGRIFAVRKGITRMTKVEPVALRE